MNYSTSAPASARPAVTRNVNWRETATALGDLLRRLAAPTFALMAALSAVSERAPAIMCSSTHAGHLSGMTAMYLLMAVFHLSVWLPRATRSDLQSTLGVKS